MSLRRLVLSVLVSVLGVLAFASAPAFAGPPAAPTIEEAFTTEVASTSAILHAQVNPQGATTIYTFEYAPVGGAFTPVPEPGGSGSIVEGTSGVLVNVSMQQGLAPNTSYQFRLVARNSVEAVTGEPVSFTTQRAGGAPALPDGRQWEMVSPSQKHGALIYALSQGPDGGSALQAAANGDALSYLTSAPTEANPQGYTQTEQVLSTRGSAGWESRDVSPPHSEPTGTTSVSEYQFFSSDLSRGVLQPFGNFEPALSVEGSEQTAFLRTDYLNGDVNEPCAASCYRPLVTGKPGYANVPPGTEFGKYQAEAEITCNPLQSCGPQFVSATPDLGHVVLRSQVALSSGPAEAAGNGYLYEWSGGRLAPVGVLPDGELADWAQLGFVHSRNVRNAISADGSRVVWYQEEGNEKALYLRDTVRGETIKIVRENGQYGGPAVAFQIASSDGSRVFFSTNQQLTPNSGAKGAAPDLYECEVVEVAGRLQCKLSDLTPQNASGEAANVQGLVLGASEDGSSVYFVADGVLAPGAVPGNCAGGAPPGATCNLYVSHDGATKLVAVLSPQDSRDWDSETTNGLSGLTARVSPNGRWLAFMSERELTGYDNRDALTGERDQEVYLYDAQSARLACASCDPTRARPVGAADRPGLVDGEGIMSGQRLAANIPPWTHLGQFGPWYGKAVYQSRYLSDSGRLFFNSHDALVPRDVNGNWDVYQYEPPGVGSCSASAATFSERSGGCVGLISSGTSSEESAFLDASESGGDVFFLTASRLSGQDTDTALDVYDAHECTGESPCLPASAAQPPACITEASCKASPTPQPGVYGLPSSATFSGPGNVAGGQASSPPVVARKTVKCSKGKRLSRGRCVKAKAKRKGKAHKAKRASHDRRASR